MGKEATIGLSVILILLITFGVVLVRRLSGWTDPAATPSVAHEEEGSPKAADDAGFAEAKAEPPGAAPRTLRVLAAKPAASQMWTPSPATASQLAVVPDRQTDTERTSADMVSIPPPLVMPDPPTPVRADHRGGYGPERQQSESPPVGPLRPVGAAVAAAGRELYGPFRSPVDQSATAEATQVAPTRERLRSLGPPLRMPRESGTQAYDAYQGPSAYSSDYPARSQTRAWRETSPHGSYPMQAQRAQPSPFPEEDSRFERPYAGQDLRNAEGDYEVQPNDSYWVISQKLYGSGAYFKALAEHNRSKVPREDRLDVGEVISAPSVVELEKAYPGLCPKPSRREAVRRRASLVSTRTPYVAGRVYVVEEGDTLFDIARYELGKASRWDEIYRLNRDLVGDDPHYISAGMQLVLPDDQPSDRVTRRPGSTYQP